MRRFRIGYYLLLSIFITVSTDTYSQTRYITKTVDINIPTVLDLQITSGANPVANFDQTGKIDAGIELLSATTISYKSNKAWFVTIKSATPNFSGGVSGNPMPASVIGFRLSGSGSGYTALSSTEAPLISSSIAQSPRGTGSESIDFRVNPGYLYSPAQDYTLQIVYTISNL